MTHRRRLLVFLTCDVFLLSLGYAFRVPLLTGLANLWTVSDPIANADAIVVLGGGLDYRPMEAAKLYREGCAPIVLVTRPGLQPADILDVTRPEADIAHDLLVKNGVPDSAIVFVGNGVANTFEESHAVLDWVTHSGAKSVLVPTGLFHTRRVRWIFRKTFREAGANVTVVSANPSGYRATNWWHGEAGLLAFQNEVLKLAFYRLRY